MKCYNATNERGVGMPLSEAARLKKNAYNLEYQKKLYGTKKRYEIKFKVEEEQAYIDWLDSKGNVTGYLRSLIDEDMKKSRG